MLIELNISQAESVVSLVNGGPESRVESINQFCALIGLVRLEPPMQSRANLEVFRIVVNEIQFFVACTEEIAQAPCIDAAIARVIKHRFVLIPIDVDCVKSSGIVRGNL